MGKKKLTKSTPKAKKAITKKTTAKKNAGKKASAKKIVSKAALKKNVKTTKKKVILKDLLLKKFDPWKPEKQFQVEIDQETLQAYTAPLFVAESSKDADRIKGLLLRKFDPESMRKAIEELKAEAEKKAAAEKAAKEKAEKEAKEKAEQEKIAAEKAAREKAEVERRAAEKAAKEKAEAERKAAAEKAAAEKVAREKAEAEKVAAEKAAKEKAEAEKKAAAEKAAKEKAEKEKAEKVAREKAEAERKAAEKAAKEKAEAEQKAAAEKAEAEKVAREKAEAEKAAAEKAAKEKAAQERAAAERVAAEKAAVEKAAAKKALEEKKAAKLRRNILAASAGVAVIFLILIGISFSNMNNFYLKPAAGGLEIWKGSFMPIGQRQYFVLQGVELQEPIKEVYSKKDVYPLIFNFYLKQADNLLKEPDIPDFDKIKNNLNKALDYGVTAELRTTAQSRLNRIDWMVLVYKADMAAAQNNLTALGAAMDYYQAAAKLNSAEHQAKQLERKIEAVVQKISLLEQQTAIEEEPLFTAGEETVSEVVHVDGKH